MHDTRYGATFRRRIWASRVGRRPGNCWYERSELWPGTASWHGGFCGAPPRPQRGTSPSPRVVFDRTTFPSPHPFWIPAFAGMTNGGPERRWDAANHELQAAEAVYPGSESGTCFRTNRSSRLAPAHQGMKSWSCGLVQRVGTADSAAPHPDPSGGQAPALHSPLPTPGFRPRIGVRGRLFAGITMDL